MNLSELVSKYHLGNNQNRCLGKRKRKAKKKKKALFLKISERDLVLRKSALKSCKAVNPYLAVEPKELGEKLWLRNKQH